MNRQCYLVRDEHIPAKPAWPVIDAHNHLWGSCDVAELVETMNAVGVIAYCDLTANVSVEWADGGYVLGQGDIAKFFAECDGKYPGRFYCFTAATFAVDKDKPLFTDADEFVARTINMIDDHVAQGARGLKILKELGLHYRDGQGELINLDDERLSKIWDHAGKLGIPVLMHQSDPVGFFEPITPENEHYDSLQKYPTWSFADPKFPRKAELIERRDQLVARHSNTTFILPHVANYAEDLDYVSDLLEANPNVYIDFSARIDELGRQPYRAREFMIRWQNRIIFGVDMPGTAEVYRCNYRFLETRDEFFFTPDYDGEPNKSRWPVCGLGLPDEVLAKIYYRNALRIIPGLKELLGDKLPD